MNTEQRLAELAVSDTGFVFDPQTGATYTVNASGREILEGLKAGLDREQIVAALEARFEVEGENEDLYRDVDEFVQLMRTNGLVDREQSP